MSDGQNVLPDLTRRQALKLGAGVALAGAGWTATARADSAAPADVRAAGDLALWYDEAAGSDWLRALPVGNGRLGAMVYGNTDTERLQLNEDTLWAGGPHDYANPRGAGAIAQIRQLVFANQWGQAQSLIDQTMRGSPSAQLPYQPLGDLRLTLPRHQRRLRVRALARPHHRDVGRHLHRGRGAAAA